jgi:hypothetical protein
MWTLQRLADYMAEQTGIRASIETVRLVRHPQEKLCSRGLSTRSAALIQSIW